MSMQPGMFAATPRLRLKGRHYRQPPLAPLPVLVAILLIGSMLTAISALLGPVSPANAAIAFVQADGFKNAASDTTAVQAFGSSNGAGNTIVVGVTWKGQGSVVCSDSGGNKYQTISQQYEVSNDQSMAVCFATGITAGSNTVTATFGASRALRGLLIAEYSGVSTANPIDTVATNVATGTAAANNISSTSLTTASNGSLIVGIVENTAVGTSSITEGTGFTERESVGSEEFHLEDMTQSSAGSTAATWTFNVTSQTYIAHAIAFRAAAASMPSTPANLGDGIGLYGVNNDVPMWRSYSSSTDTFASAKVLPGMFALNTVVRTSPLRQEAVAAWNDQTGWLNVACFDGTAWNYEWSVNVGGTGQDIRFDVAYETNSGDALVMYSTNTTSTSLGWRTKAGSTGCGSSNWTAESTTNPAQSGGTVQYVVLAADARQSSNLITAIFADDASDLDALVWTGSSWTNEPTAALDTSLEFVSSSQDVNNFDVAYEALSGDVMIVWGASNGNDGTNGAYYAACTGGTSGCTWVTKTQIGGGTGDDATNLDLSANPLSDEMVFASIGNAGSDLQAAYWSGSAWSFSANLDSATATPAAGTKLVATGWMVNGVTARALIVFNDSATVDVKYFMWNGTVFGLADTPSTYDVSPNMANPQKWFDIQADPLNSQRTMLLISDNASDLHAKRASINAAGSVTWSAADGGAVLESSLRQALYQPFAFAYWRFPARALLTQQGYIFENDDEDQATGDAVDENTQQAAGNTAITNVKQGERITARLQLNNTGTPLDADLALFYDRNDGMWSKVRADAPAVTSSGTCDNTAFSCTAVDTSGTVGNYTSMAVDPSGRPWVAYLDVGNSALRVANYVGTGGTGCASSAWSCVTVDLTGFVNRVSLAIDPSGVPWVAYQEMNNNDLMVAHYVGTGGTGCAVSSWTCSAFVTTETDGAYPAIAFDPSGNPWVSFHDNQNGYLRVARYVGSNGSGCGNSAWVCTTVDTNNDAGEYTSIAFDSSGNPWVSYYAQTSKDLRVARYVGTGGTGCASSAWTCTAVDTSDEIYQYATSIAFDPSGNAWVSYHYLADDDLRVARYVGSGGTGCASSAWTCTDVKTDDSVGFDTSIAFDPSGKAWVTFRDADSGSLDLARYVGSGGTGCDSVAWTCTTIQTTGNAGTNSSIAFDKSGNPWISYYSTGSFDLHVATLDRGGEITAVAGMAGANGDPLNESHVDMSSSTDTTGRDDADCSASSTTFTSGKWFDGEFTSGLQLPSGTTTAQCTEVAFVLDTSRAVAGTTYRFAIASKDGRPDKSVWRGPISIVNYPTLTIEASTALRASKATNLRFSNCSDTAWGCMTVESGPNSGSHSSIGFDNESMPWAAYYNSTSDALRVARYVGSGGTGCAVTSWSCTTIATGAGLYSSIAFDKQGNPWITTHKGTSDLMVARYVGSGGTGCAVTSWTCVSVDTANVVGLDTSIAFDPSGNAWISYFEDTNDDLRIARYVGSGGTGCASTEWTCVVVDASNAGRYSSIGFDNTGAPWVSYQGLGSSSLRVARFVGGGGSGCTIDSWDCTTVEDTANVLAATTSLAMDSSGNPWISYFDDTSDDLRVARYVGSGGAGCSSSAWTCTGVDTSNIYGQESSIAFDTNGNAWVSYYDGTGFDLRVARYVSSGGSGCASSAWTCSSVDTTNTVGRYSSLAFDRLGTPWVSYQEASTGYLRIAKLHMATGTAPSATTYANPGRNAHKGDGSYRLDWGDTARPVSGGCNATANKGYCALIADDTDYDTMQALADENPIYAFATRSATNSSFPSNEWKGQSSVSTATRNVKIDIYRFGSTNAWVTLDTQSAAGASTQFTLNGTASAGSASDYWQSDGSNYWAYYRVWQVAHAPAETLSSDYFGPPDVAPGAPSSLAQKTPSDVVLSTGTWLDSDSVKFTATVTDPDNPDTLQLCVEAKPLAQAFANVEDDCGSGEAYSGSGVTATVTLMLTDAVEYHWQARARDAAGLYSSWVSYDVNAESARDIGVDTTAPTGGTVYDGTNAGVDVGFNTGSLTLLSANWSGFDVSVAGIASYSYSIGTTAGAADVKTLTSVGTATSVNASGLSLHTGQTYYFRVVAYDNAGNNSYVDSNGQTVAPTLSFDLSAATLNFTTLDPAHSFTSTDALAATVTTNAYNGYQVTQFAEGLLTSSPNTIAMYSAPWADPTVWAGTGLGYTSSDTSVSGSNRFAGGAEYAGVANGSPGDLVADSTTTAVSGDVYTLTYKLVIPSTQLAGRYATNFVLSAVAAF